MGPDQTLGNAPAVTRAVRILGLLADAPDKQDADGDLP